MSSSPSEPFLRLPSTGSAASSRETPRFLQAHGKQEDESGKIVSIKSGANKDEDGKDAPSQPIRILLGRIHRLASDEKLLPRLIGASAAWFLMDAAYYGNTVSSPLVLSALSSDTHFIA